MTNKQLLFLVALINVIMMFLLIYKQNKIIKELYQLQQLHEKKNELLEKNKELLLQLHKNTQLSKIEQIANNNFDLQRMTLKDVSKIPIDTPPIDTSIEEPHANT